MGTFLFEGQKFNAQDGETVLDCLLRNEVYVSNSCQSGICHSCLLKSNSKLDNKSQKGLDINKQEAGYFLACQQPAYSGLEVFRFDTSKFLSEGKITSQERVSASVVIIKIKISNEYNYKAGQFTNIMRSDGLSRPYSIASQTGCSELEFHIRKIPNGNLSNWFYDEDLINEVVKISEPLGDCSLRDDMEEENLLLIGVGTGLAPLYGIIHDAIKQKTKGKVTLFHAGLNRESLYLVEKLKYLETEYDFFSYHPVYLNGEEKEGFKSGNVVDIIRGFNYSKSNTIVMICGDPQLVKNLKQEVFLSGVPSKKIFSDSFITIKK